MTWDVMALWKRTMNMLTSLDNWTITYCKRSANRVADLLARNEIPVVTDLWGSLPPPVQSVFQEEQEKAVMYTKKIYYQPAQEPASSSNNARQTGGSSTLARLMRPCAQTNDHSNTKCPWKVSVQPPQQMEAFFG